MKKLIIYLFIITFTKNLCTKGCLKCTFDFKCLICDTTNFYKSINNTCEKIIKPNCSKINLQGDCLTCKTSYWLNSTTKKCVLVENEKIVKNCVLYSNSQICKACEPHFFIDGGICKGVDMTAQLMNCKVYQLATTCASCDDGFYVSSDQKKCLSFGSKMNCNFLSQFECSSCRQNYFLNRNLYFLSSSKMNSSLEKENVLDNILYNKFNTKIHLNNPVCQEIIIKNCLVYESFKTCKTCSPGYFLKTDEKSCSPFPKPTITNCLTYSSNTSCTKCKQGFYPTNITQCKAITPIDQCLEYSQIDTATKCLLCTPEYYISSPTSCVQRTISASNNILNCQTKSIIADKCIFCNQGYILSSGGDECVIALANCKTHAAFSKGFSPTCSICSNGFYLNNNICTAGTDVNCFSYLNTGTCDICKNKFYHIGTNSCLEHSNITNCLDYLNTTKNTCKTCNSVTNTFNFEIEKSCKLLNEIVNCKVYSHDKNDPLATPICDECKDGFIKTDSFTCSQLQVASCKKGTSVNVCTECQDGFVLFNFNGTLECKYPHEYMTDQCETISSSTTGGTNGLQNVICENCKINALTVDYTNNYVCVRDEYLKDTNTINKPNLITSCLKYNGNDCVLCDNGKYLKHDKTECLDNCGSFPFYPLKIVKTTSSGTDYNHVGFYNLCNSATVDNVAMIGVDREYITNEINIKCKDNKVTAVAGLINSSHKTSNIDIKGSFDNWVSNIGTSNPEVSCPTTSTTINGQISSTLLSNCQYYKQGSI